MASSRALDWWRKKEGELEVSLRNWSGTRVLDWERRKERAFSSTLSFVGHLFFLSATQAAICSGVCKLIDVPSIVAPPNLLTTQNQTKPSQVSSNETKARSFRRSFVLNSPIPLPLLLLPPNRENQMSIHLVDLHILVQPCIATSREGAVPHGEAGDLGRVETTVGRWWAGSWGLGGGRGC